MSAAGTRSESAQGAADVDVLRSTLLNLYSHINAQEEAHQTLMQSIQRDDKAIREMVEELSGDLSLRTALRGRERQSRNREVVSALQRLGGVDHRDNATEESSGGESSRTRAASSRCSSVSTISDGQHVAHDYDPMTSAPACWKRRPTPMPKRRPRVCIAFSHDVDVRHRDDNENIVGWSVNTDDGKTSQKASMPADTRGRRRAVKARLSPRERSREGSPVRFVPATSTRSCLKTGRQGAGRKGQVKFDDGSETASSASSSATVSSSSSSSTSSRSSSTTSSTVSASSERSRRVSRSSRSPRRRRVACSGHVARRRQRDDADDDAETALRERFTPRRRVERDQRTRTPFLLKEGEYATPVPRNARFFDDLGWGVPLEAVRATKNLPGRVRT